MVAGRGAERSRAQIRSLSLTNFRNFERLELELPADGVVLVGDNGQGKTNLLESIYYFSLLRSVRGARDADVARTGSPGFFLAGRLCAGEPAHLAIGFERATRRKRVRRNETIVERLSDALGALPAVMFAPTDVGIVAGGPASRRRYLDIMLALSSRGYLQALQAYRAALETRNAAIRDVQRRRARGGATGPRDGAVDVWEPPLATHGAALVRSRRLWITRARARFAELCAAIGERGRLDLRYDPSVNASAESVEEELAAALAANRDSDLRHGQTQVGPHRDAVGMLLEGRELRTFGSAGQQRTAAIALRTLEAETLREARDCSPVYLLDDPFAELDARRAARVLDLLERTGLGQTILAVPRETDIPRELSRLRRLRVVDGRVEEEAAAS